MKNSLRFSLLFLIILFTSAKGISQVLPLDFQPKIWIKGTTLNPGNNQSFDSRNNGYTIQWNTPFTQDTLNFHPVLAIDSSIIPNTLNLIPEATDAEYVVYTVYYPKSSDRSGIYNIRFDSTDYSHLTTTSFKSNQKEIFYTDSVLSKPVINKAVLTWKSRNIDSNLVSFSLFGNDSLSYSGQFAELIIMDTTIGKQANEQIHTYLALTYGISLVNLNYRNTEGNIIWNTANAFSHATAGIGRDDSLQIYQKQTQGNNGDNELTVSLGTPQKLNSLNTHTIPNNQFMIWGHNDQPLEINPDTSDNSIYHNLLKRHWKIRFTGDSATTLNPLLIFDATAFDSSSTVSLVQHSDSNYFDKSGSLVYYPDSVIDQNYYFSNIQWDTDTSGSDYFTFKIDSTSAMFYSLTDTTRQDTPGDDAEVTYSLFPNPSTGDFAVSCSSTEPVTVHMAIFDLNGRLVEKVEPMNGKYTYRQFHIDEPGTYFVQIAGPNQTKTFKIIITP